MFWLLRLAGQNVGRVADVFDGGGAELRSKLACPKKGPISCVCLVNESRPDDEALVGWPDPGSSKRTS